MAAQVAWSVTGLLITLTPPTTLIAGSSFCLRSKWVWLVTLTPPTTLTVAQDYFPSVIRTHCKHKYSKPSLIGGGGGAGGPVD